MRDYSLAGLKGKYGWKPTIGSPPTCIRQQTEAFAQDHSVSGMNALNSRAHHPERTGSRRTESYSGTGRVCASG